MEKNKFYVGQEVAHHEFGDGVVTKINYLDNFPVIASFGGDYGTFTLDGRYMKSEEPSLFPKQPSIKLTEWQRNRLIDKLEITPAELSVIESILSQPEPPKYSPNNGDAVLFPNTIWMAAVFTNMVGEKYRIAASGWSGVVDEVRPFDAELLNKSVE